MRATRTIWLCVLVLMAGCGPTRDVKAIEQKAQALVARQASTQEVAASFGRSPIHIITREEAVRYLNETSPQDTTHKFWSRVSQYPQTHYFPIPGGEILIFFDESERAAGFYSNIQL